MAAVAFTVLHIVLDWKMFKAGMRYLVHRHPMPEHHEDNAHRPSANG